VLNIAVIVSLLGLVFTVANTSKLALTGVAALLVVALANLVYVRDNATAYEAKHPFDYNKYAMQQGSQGLPLIWWGQTSREDLDMVFRETLEFMATIPYRLLDQHTKKYNQAIERAHKQAGKVN
jgi:ABC-type nickel/cobalt efflux system permease component RcnA